MTPYVVCPAITAFIGVRPRGEFFEGYVSILQGRPAKRIVHACLGVSDTEEEALEDARRDAVALVKMCRQRVELQRRRP